MRNKIIIFFAFLVLIAPFSGLDAADTTNFRIMTQSDSGDYIGQAKSWDFSKANNTKITVSRADENQAVFNISDFVISNMTFEFGAETGKTLSKGLYTPAKRFPFRDSFNGINVSGDGRGCNRVLGAFYVHEYVVNNGILERAAIDFVHICEPQSTDINQVAPKLYGSLRYGSSIADSCNNLGCAEAKKNVGITAAPAPTASNPVIPTAGSGSTTTQNTSPTVSQINDFNLSIVKIRSYGLTNYQGLEATAEGSGVIISEGGIVLTNDHVISTRSNLDNSLYDETYQVCVTKEANKTPSCDYLAKVIARNEDKDLALLQIVKYPGGVDLISFKPLKLSASDQTITNDAVRAVGFPSIGEDTITVTSGIVSGKMEKYGNQWIKTDAVVAYGSSGGAALNKASEIIGITTQVYSDTSGELGYILSVNSINDWVSNNIGRSAQNSKYFNRLAELTKKQKILEESNTYINLYPWFSFVKPASWTFDHYSQEVVTVTNKSDQNSGYVIAHLFKAPYELDNKAIKARLNRYFNEAGVSGAIKYIKEKDADLGGVRGKQMTLMAGKKVMNSYAVPINNFVVWIEYGYGKNDKDKKIIEDIIKSFKFKKLKPNYLESRTYTNSSPKFSINTNGSWAVLQMDNKSEPVHIYNKKINEAYVGFSVDKIGDDESRLSDNDFVKIHKDRFNIFNQQTKALDYKYEVGKTATNVKLNSQVTAIRVDGIERNVSQNNILAFDRDYFIKIDGYRLNINLTVYSDNKAIFDKAVKEFDAMLKALKIK